MDYANGATIILSDQDGKKTGVVYGIKFFEEGIEDDDDYVGESEEELDYMNPNYKKTGRTKNIAGYKCEEYVFDTEEEKGSFWVTDKAGWKANDTFSAIFRAGLYSRGVYQGMLMESESTEWVKAVIWKNDGQSTKVADFLKKGRKVLLEGVPSSEGFKSKDGDIKSALNLNVKELEFLS